MDVLGQKPFSKIITITASSGTNFQGPNQKGPGSCAIADALICGGTGNVVYVAPDGDTFTAAMVPGQILYVQAIRVNSTTGTGSTGLGACYY